MNTKRLLKKLIGVSRAAHFLTEDTCEENGQYTIDEDSFLKLSAALDELDKLPEPKGFIVATGTAKAEAILLSSAVEQQIKRTDNGDELCEHHWNGSDRCFECYCTGCGKHIAEVDSKESVPFKDEAFCFKCRDEFIENHLKTPKEPVPQSKAEHIKTCAEQREAERWARRFEFVHKEYGADCSGCDSGDLLDCVEVEVRQTLNSVKMSEQTYIDVSNLAKVRTAKSIINDLILVTGDKTVSSARKYEMNFILSKMESELDDKIKIGD